MNEGSEEGQTLVLYTRTVCVEAHGSRCQCMSSTIAKPDHRPFVQVMQTPFAAVPARRRGLVHASIGMPLHRRWYTAEESPVCEESMMWSAGLIGTYSYTIKDCGAISADIVSHSRIASAGLAVGLMWRRVLIRAGPLARPSPMSSSHHSSGATCRNPMRT